MKTANTKARALLGKLERLADPANGGTPDEVAAAKRKLQRLKGRIDFTAPAPAETMDIFAGLKFKRHTGRAAHVHTFQPADFDVASAVKWAIEEATGIRCVFRGGALLAEATPGTANKLAKVALHNHPELSNLARQTEQVERGDHVGPHAFCPWSLRRHDERRPRHWRTIALTGCSAHKADEGEKRRSSHAAWIGEPSIHRSIEPGQPDSICDAVGRNHRRA